MSEHPGEAIERRIKKDFYDSLDRRSAAAQPAPGRWRDGEDGPRRDAGKDVQLVNAEYINALEAERDALREALELAESVYRLNVVVLGEPSSVLDAMQAALRKHR